MSVRASRLRGKQRAWAENFEQVTGFEAMYQDDFQNRGITFDEFKSLNLRWLEDHHIETYQSAERGSE